jgi:hypothetical protein
MPQASCATGGETLVLALHASSCGACVWLSLSLWGALLHQACFAITASQLGNVVESARAACLLTLLHILLPPFCLMQMLVHLGVEADDPLAPDWGAIAVYSCSASCDSGVTAGASSPDESAYLEEFVWVQESA